MSGSLLEQREARALGGWAELGSSWLSGTGFVGTMAGFEESRGDMFYLDYVATVAVIDCMPMLSEQLSCAERKPWAM